MNFGVLGGDQRFVVGIFQTDGLLATAANAAAFLDYATRISQASFGYITLEQLVDNMVLYRISCADWRTTDDHLQRLRHASQTREALSAASTGQQAKFHLRQAHLGVRAGDAVVAAEGNLQSAAQRGAVDDRNAWLVARLDDVDYLRQTRRLWRLAELLDISTRVKGAPFADQHDDAYLRVRFGVLKSLQQALAHGMTKRIDRWVVDRDQSDLALMFEPYDVRHDRPPLVKMMIGFVISRNHVSHSRIVESFLYVEWTAIIISTAKP